MGMRSEVHAPPLHLQPTRLPLKDLAWRVLGWAIPLAFLVWAARLAVLEGYVYEIPRDFLGDFTRTAALQATTYWAGQGLFYGPIFILEYRFLWAPGLLGGAAFAQLDYVLFLVAFACTWAALFGAARPRLAIFVLAAWLGHHASVEAFANTAHLEVLELALICAALLLAVRGQVAGAGASLGLAIATKTLPVLFVPYVLLSRQWRMAASAVAVAGALFLLACAVQQTAPWDGVMQLAYQGGNLTKLDFTEYEYSPRADIARTLAGSASALTPDQTRLAVGAHAALALIVLAFSAWLVLRQRARGAPYGLLFGLVGALILVVSPSVHIPYYIFLLPGWTAILAELLRRPPRPERLLLGAALVLSYVFSGFDQPFFLLQRLTGSGLVVPQHWLAWHLPLLAVFVSLGTLAYLLLTLDELDAPRREQHHL